MKEKTYNRGKSFVTVRLCEEYLSEFLLIMEELTRFGYKSYSGTGNLWSPEGWKDAEGDDDDDDLVEENKTFSVKIAWSNISKRRRPKHEMTVGGSVTTMTTSMETEVTTTQSVIDAVKDVASMLFDEVEIIETDGLCDPSRWVK